ncbi:toprim domain-containing protein [Niallia sp. Krafla_26]|uniref:toprim domain-containing protein n=1 Tax=Niallia sp. Krafla_26 TaxID=3064703 RepID=UPI003D16BF6D
MRDFNQNKVIIVEGISDRNKIKKIIKEPIEIICTNGTISADTLEEWIETLFDCDLYILVDADESGKKLRQQLKREFPNAVHLYIDKMYREVATAPHYHLATILLTANIEIHSEYLDRGKNND